MRKRVISKGNLHRSDYLRALVTDTIPGDIPIIVSNDGFYKNLKHLQTAPIHCRDFIDMLMSPSRSYTRPYRYHILRPGGGVRRLSLTHPAAQEAVAAFYREYGNLICYYCRKSPASIRSPAKVGSLFFVRGPQSEANRLRGSSIDTTDLETAVSNPASYFSYRGYNRAYKFFSSTDYMRLEKRYRVMHFADISKCFASIYTHTLFWATADVETAKDNTRAVGFSNSFDHLMQSMNFNETNGIAVGSEVSRLFAEVILSEVDRRIIARMRKSGKSYRVHYEFRRYVDDYFLFSEDIATSKRLLAETALALGEFNLHLNEQKTKEIARPFITKKSRLIRETNDSLNSFFERFLDPRIDADGPLQVPKRIWRPSSLLRSFLDSIKATCFDHESGYEGISNYVIAALAVRIGNLVDTFERGVAQDGVSSEEYVSAIMLLLEGIYFFYNVNPSVPSSLRVAQAAIQAANFIKKRVPARSTFLGEQLVRWTFQFLKSLGSSLGPEGAECVPLEALNVLLVLGEVGRNDAIAQKAIIEFCGDVASLHYFEIVSFLFCIKDDPEFTDLRTAILVRSRELLFNGPGVRIDAQAAHLALDLLACPYFSVSTRSRLFADLRADLGLPAIGEPELAVAVAGFEKAHWFVNWRETNLLRMIRKKELSEVY